MITTEETDDGWRVEMVTASGQTLVAYIPKGLSVFEISGFIDHLRDEITKHEKPRDQ